MNPLFVSGYSGTVPKTAAQIATEEAAVGLSVLRVKKTGGKWKLIGDDTTYTPGSTRGRRPR